MLYNPNVKLGALPVNTTWATLKTVDDKLTFDFILNPETVTWTHTSSVSELAVLRTRQPLANYQNSKSVLTLPGVKLWTLNNSGSLKESLDTLREMTKPLAGTGVLPLLALTWGNLNEPRVYLVSLDITETQWRSGIATKATVNMTFMLAPAIPKATYQELPKADPVSTSEANGTLDAIKATDKDPKLLTPTELANRRKAETTIKNSLGKTDAASKALVTNAYKALKNKPKVKPNAVDKSGKVITGNTKTSEYDVAKAYWDNYFKGKR